MVNVMTEAMPGFFIIFTLVFAIFALRLVTRAFRHDRHLRDDFRHGRLGDDSWHPSRGGWGCRRCRAANPAHGRFCRMCGEPRD